MVNIVLIGVRPYRANSQAAIERITFLKKAPYLVLDTVGHSLPGKKSIVIASNNLTII